MCRVFGFRSVIESKVHNSLIHAENALEVQSKIHSDGWGVAYYIQQTPHVIRSEKAAMDDRLFQKISGIVRSKTVVAHVRKATEGHNDILNTHPFQFGPWIFVHNGHIKNFETHRDTLLSQMDDDLKSYILGSTDSELIFYFLLSNMKKSVDFKLPGTDFNALIDSLHNSIDSLIDIIGPLSEGCPEDQPCNENYLTFILTNGSTMLGYQGGQQLHYSTYKSSCPEKNECPFFNDACENEINKGKINHLVFSSEPVEGENTWVKMDMGQMIGVDDYMNVYKSWIKK